VEHFFNDHFLLDSEPARILFNEYARDMPIFDFHNHLSPKEIADDRRFETITDLWLGGDHYKWRVMRAAGVDESLITGDAPKFEKFRAWSQVLTRIPGNALYHWTHMELSRYFGIDEPLTPQSATAIWDECNRQLQGDDFTSRAFLRRAGVRALCTTDDPFDDLRYHLELADSPIKVLPTFRPDKLLNIHDKSFPQWIEAMRQGTGLPINSFEDLKRAICAALDHFKRAGCVITDHAFVTFEYTREGSAASVFGRALSGLMPTAGEAVVYRSELMRFLAGEYAALGMAMQLHIGAIRNNNSRMFAILGPDTGYDSIGPCTDPAMLSMFLDDLAAADSLPNTILYCLNPADNPVMATMAVNFADSSVAAKVQFGSAWWFLDTLRGIRAQLQELTETGLLSGFVGMLTDSRSFSSFVRHEYFRRILCHHLGGFIARGEYPADYDAMGLLAQDICYNNAVRFMNL
jgi:glucuronate isomerase